MNRSIVQMQEGTREGQHDLQQQQQQEQENRMPHAHVIMGEPRLDNLLSSTVVRPDAVARARRLLASQSWCRAEEVADHLVECLVGKRLP
ncbi:MAG: hypothetical protein QOK43_3058 [Acidimicrobiaceae bacterium]|jgi:hypothetical protein|nr:hypothetical protein [Acidimicrobiaceae bacterium]MDQ1445477.1 hypothetical protein [Acidimicrobiaceae bacterium]